MERSLDIVAVIAARQGGTKTANFLLRPREVREFFSENNTTNVAPHRLPSSVCTEVRNSETLHVCSYFHAASPKLPVYSAKSFTHVESFSAG